MKDVVANYEAHGVPLESVWLDGNYMQDHKNFFVDSKNFTDLKTYTEELHQNGIKMVVTLYGGLGYDADEENKYIILANDTFIMDNTGKAFDA